MFTPRIDCGIAPLPVEIVSSTATVAKSATGCGTSYLIPDRNPFFNKKVL